MSNDNTQDLKLRMFADFEALKSDLGVAAETFYRHLFELNPDLRKQFANVDMESQGQMLFQALGLVIGGLENFDELRPVLENLGYRHAGYGVIPEHYHFATEALVLTLREHIGGHFSEQSEADWRGAMQLVTSTMIDGVTTIGARVAQAGKAEEFQTPVRPSAGEEGYLAKFLTDQDDETVSDWDSNLSVDVQQRFQVTYEGERVVEASPLQTFLQVSLQNGIPHICECGGKAKCTTCRVVITDGLEHCLPRNQLEARMARLKGFSPEVRLGCQTRITGAVTARRLVHDKLDVNEAVEEGHHGVGREMQLAVMFADIRGFTSMSSENLPYDIIHALNRYFRVVCEAIDGHNGYIDKYIGDGLMALFGLSGQSGEQACREAVQAALAMQRSMTEVNHYLQGHLGMEFSIGIGVHYGSVVVGELGFRLKRQFTAVGDVVNTASRIEGKTKELSAAILISNTVRERLADSGFTFGSAVEVQLAGKDSDVAVSEVLVGGNE